MFGGGGGQFGPYELRGELGRGAMARVWRAYDPNLGREVAIKEPLFDSNLSDQVREEMGRRFVKEARTAAQLNHPNIVTIYAADVYDGRPAIVMELVEGSTLGAILSNGPLEPPVALSVLDQLLDAVGHAHSKGVIHRDIKPDNIFVDPQGHVKLSDFGIAHADDGATRATVAGTVLGTPGYMSPEQAQGAEVDERSDLFSVGVVAYEMLTGRNPFGAGDGSDAVTLLYRIVHEPVEPLPDFASAGLPADLRPAVMAALSKDPAARPQNAAAFKAMLHGGAYAPAAVPAADGNLAKRVNVASKGRPKWLPYAIAGGGCVIALVIVLIATGALSGGGSAGGGNAGGGNAPGQSQVASGMYYLGVSNGKVAIYSNSSAEPYRETDIAASDLDAASAADVDAHISFDSVADAENQIDEYRASIEAAKKKEEEERKKKEEEERKKAEAEAAKGSTVEISITGAGGDVRTATIHRQGTSERVFPDSNTRYLSDSEVSALSDAERCIAWNEIIAASNGYAFKNSGLAAYFNKCSWYSPNPGASGMGDLTDAGRANVDLLKSYTDSWWMNLATN